MSGLKFNFNKPKVPEKKAVPGSSKTAFDDDADDENVFTQPKSSTTLKKKKQQPEAVVNVNQDLRNYTSLSEETAARMAKEALEEDPSVFAYDDVYDDLKAVEREKKAIAEQQRLERKPQYMDKLLASAEVRKRDFLLAQEKKYQKERETEGDEFEGKEKFVTTSYKRQQEELRKAEEEEKKREENLRKGSRGMASFYQKMMEEEELKHAAAVRAAATAPPKRDKTEDVEVEITRDKRLADEARRINAELGSEAVAVNDEGEVVDKRQLLKGGLNVFAPKQAPQVARSEYQEQYDARRASEKQKARERDSQVRQKRAVEEQYESVKKRAANEEAEREEEIRLRAKSKKTGDEVMGARERYLARKQAATAGK